MSKIEYFPTPAITETKNNNCFYIVRADVIEGRRPIAWQTESYEKRKGGEEQSQASLNESVSYRRSCNSKEEVGTSDTAIRAITECRANTMKAFTRTCTRRTIHVYHYNCNTFNLRPFFFLYIVDAQLNLRFLLNNYSRIGHINKHVNNY